MVTGRPCLRPQRAPVGAYRPLELQRSCSQTSSEATDAEEEASFEPLKFDEDTYSLTVGLLVRDLHLHAKMAKQASPQGSWAASVSRLVATTWLLILTLALQLYCLYNVKHLVSAKAVHDMRILYDQFEIHMYGNNISRMDVTPNGKHRGRPEYFRPENFDTLPEIVKEGSCCIPLSQPAFFFAILFVWSVTCVGELTKIWRSFYCLVVATDTVTDMACCGSGNTSEADVEDEHVTNSGNETEGYFLIKGVTVELKLIFSFVFFIPRIILTFFLLWIGCRYLCATADFATLILNALAFQFILNLKDVVYSGLAPVRTKVHLTGLRMLPELRYKVLPPHENLRHVVSVATITALWVWCYMRFFQAVIPDYRWDVHSVCAHYISVRYAV